MKTLYSIPIHSHLLSVVPDKQTLDKTKKLFVQQRCKLYAFQSLHGGHTTRILYTTADDKPLENPILMGLVDRANDILGYASYDAFLDIDDRELKEIRH